MALGATPQQEQFVRTYAPYAADAGKRLGVDSNIILGQWGHETGWGSSVGTQHNNLGGITAPTGQYYSYADPQQFTDHYVQLLQSKYPQVLGNGSNADKFVAGLYQGHYFTGPFGDYVADVNNGASLVQQVQARQRPPPQPQPQPQQASTTPKFDALMSEKPGAPAPAETPPAPTPKFDALMATPPAATPAQPPPQPAQPPPAPAAAPAGPVAPPIYTAPTTPLIRPGGDASTLSPDTQTQVAQSQAPMPAPTGQPAPVTTQEQANMGPGLVHGLRTAFNPLMQLGANIGTWAGNRLGYHPTWSTDLAAANAKNEAEFQAQYGPQGATPSPGAEGMAEATRVVAPMGAGLIGGGLLNLGLRAAGFPATAAFVSGAGGSNLLTRAASGATQGAIQGAIAGGGPGAAAGAGVGGLALPVAGKVADWVRGQFGAAVVPAVQKIYQALVRDGITPGKLNIALQQLGALGIPADVAGANLRQLSSVVANTPGPASEVAENFLDARAAGQTARLNDAVKTATGATGSAYDNFEALKTARALAAAPKYEAAFNRIVTTPAEAAQAMPWINDPIGQEALQAGLKTIRVEKLGAPGGPQPFNPADYGVTYNPATGKYELGSGVPNLRLMDAVKRGYDSIVEGYRDPVTKQLNLDTFGNAVNQARAAYVAKLRDMFPRYGAALDAWGGPSADMDALSMGKRVLSTDPDATAANVAGLTPSQQEMYRVGVADALKQRINSTPDTASGTADATRRIFGNQLVRDKLAASFGGANTPEFQAFQKTMQDEATFADTRRRIMGGSRTAPLAAAMQDANQPVNLLDPIMHFVAHGPATAVTSLARGMINPLVTRMTQPTEAANEMLGRMLFDPTARQTLINNLTPGQYMSIRNLLTGIPGQAGAAAIVNRPRQTQGAQP